MFSLLLLYWNGQAQAPINDNCENAIEIKIPGKGFDLGTYSSTSVDVKLASRQVGERCAIELEENGNCVKTVWYKFYLPTTRDVGIKLTQKDSAIPQIFSGFNVYKINDCSYSINDLSSQLTPLGKFGISGNSCLAGGWYLVQVGCKKRASGELWIDLDFKLPSNQNYDHYTGPQNANLNTITFSTVCASITSEESTAIQDSLFTKSVWLAIPVNNATTFISLKQKFDSYQSAIPIKWRIFYGVVNDDSLKSNKPFFKSEYDGTLFKLPCPDISTQNYIYVQLLVQSETNYFQLLNTIYNANTTDWNQPANALQTNLLPNIPYTPGKLDFGCMSDLATHSCKNVIPSYYTHKVKNYQKQQWDIDTFKHAGYIVLNVLADGLLRLSFDNQDYRDLRYFSLYQGDIRMSCQLMPLCDSLIPETSTFSLLCLKPGVYTLVIASRNTNDYIEPRIELNVGIELPKYIYPKKPEKFADYNPDHRLSFLSEYTSFSKDTSIVISNMRFTGGFIYREMLVTEAGEFEIGVPEKIDGYILIFKGQMSQGKISAIPTLDYSNRYRSSVEISGYSTPPTACMHFSKGYYTIIAWTGFDPKYDKSLPCLIRYNSIYVIPVQICPAQNNTEPQFAYSLRKGLDVLDTISNDGNYKYLLPSCKTCNTKSKIKPFISCSNKKYISPNTTYHYHTFYISENASVFMPGSSYELFKGDVLTDGNIIFDSSKIIAPCGIGKVICNLPGPQVYTLIVFNSGNTTIGFAKHRVSVNDFASNPYDFGHVTGTVIAPPIPVTCHTNGYKNEPIQYNNSQYGLDYTIPFPDTLGVKRSSQTYRTLWYTFTVSGNSKVIVKPSFGRTFITSENKTTILKYNGLYKRDFSEVLKDGLDSTFSKMEIVNHKSINYDSAEFYNEGCSENRYFVNFGHKGGYHDMDYVMDYGLSLRVTTGAQTNTGDFCNNAISGKYSKAGYYQLKVDNTCHTYGKNIYEEKYDPGIKSSWFVIEVDSLEKFNIGIRNNTGYGLIKYNVYGGSCNGMTRIATNGDRNAYFNLNCMGKGKYYIQAICNKGNNETIGFNVTIEDASNAPCKPYDFKYPIAQFDYKGGCQRNDTIQFRNLSTKGEDMEYSWYLNGKLISTEMNPVLFRTDSEVLAVNTMRLIALNTAEMLRDTFDIEYIKDTTIYEFKALGPKTIFCNDTLTLSVSTNYPGKINYKWDDFRHYEMSRKQTFRYFFPYSVPWYVSGESDGCYFKDSIFITKPQSLKKYKDTTFCAWSPYILKNESDYFLMAIYITDPDPFKSKNVHLDPGESYTIPKSGLYIVEYNIDKCYYSDSMQVTILPGAVRFVRSIDILYDCNVPSKVLKYSKDQPTKYFWSTGDTTASITATKSGIYRLTGPYSYCSSLDYTVNLTLDKINKDILRDTVVCKYDKFPFKNVLGNNFKVLYKSPNVDTVKMLGPIYRTIRLQRGECFVSDSANTNIFPFAGRTIDSFLCDPNAKFLMTLNGENALSHNWYRNNGTSQYLQINNYGNYPVARKDFYGCKDTLNFNIITNCEFTVFVPNAFSPNLDFTNETFAPFISGKYSKFNMIIFNNWGEVVFKTDNSEHWNGQSNGTYTQGVYGYLITVYDEDNKEYLFKGTVTLLY